VELWLADVASVMAQSVLQQISKAMLAHPLAPRRQWLLEWPEMVRGAVGDCLGSGCL
jgi:hypothetical protein